jgi:uncharacterized protein (TIGR00304 family)
MQRPLVLGFLIFLAGIGIIGIASAGQGNVSTGGVVFIGPFPIVFGSGPGGWVLALMSLLIGGVMIALFLFWGWRSSRMKQA